MKMRKLQLCAVVVGLATCQVANATLTFNATIGGAPVGGASVITFDSGLALNDSSATATYNYGPGSVTVSFVTDGQAVTGTQTSYAAPWVGGIGGAADTTPYLTSGKVAGSLNGQAILQFNSSQKYFGLLWGSVDTYNYLTFYDGNTAVGTLQGTQVLGSNGSIVPGNQFEYGTAYVNIFSDVPFNKVIATSNPDYAFEFDNVAVVPEPTTMIAGALLLLPFGASTLRMLRKHRTA
jgi:hypothetical protein